MNNIPWTKDDLGCLIPIGIIALGICLLLFWIALFPIKKSGVEGAPESARVNINGAQRKELSSTDAP